MVNVRQLEKEEWELYRSIRLAALSDAPHTFGSTYEREIVFKESMWRERTTRGAGGKDSICVIALDGDEGVGIAGGITVPEDPRISQLESMWVRADHRGTDVAAKLIAQVEVWAFDRGSESLVYGVTGCNDRALEFYEKIGFEPYDGDLASGSTCEVTLRKPLAVA
ncbi:MAG: GNAT family N-acetyltransferase [Candidatus Latescibacterota bacterium]|nr:GNAT family N-acetyltransferase [Candidatus Latescibacterota bacterium]